MFSVSWSPTVREAPAVMSVSTQSSMQKKPPAQTLQASQQPMIRNLFFLFVNNVLLMSRGRLQVCHAVWFSILYCVCVCVFAMINYKRRTIVCILNSLIPWSSFLFRGYLPTPGALITVGNDVVIRRGGWWVGGRQKEKREREKEGKILLVSAFPSCCLWLFHPLVCPYKPLKYYS